MQEDVRQKWDKANWSNVVYRWQCAVSWLKQGKTWKGLWSLAVERGIWFCCIICYIYRKDVNNTSLT